MISRTFANILSDRVAETRDFYRELLGFGLRFDSDWFVNLVSTTDPCCELSIWRRDHELIPDAYRAAPQGVILTIVVEDVDAAHAEAVRRGVPVVAPPRDLFYGQRSCLLLDPSGLLLDVSTPGEMSPEFSASLEETADGVVRQRSG
jgi:catechol 2,3-dioxygenase-like lactoylglutathione lyase family enzyme